MIMKKTIGSAMLVFGAFVAAVTVAQVSPQTLPASTVWGRLGISAGPGQAIPFSILQGNLQLTMTGDCTTASPNAITCTKTNGVAFAALATQAIPCLVSQGCTGLTSGTSGGVPYYSSSSAITSSGALTANLPVIGGGAGAAPAVGTRTGNTTLFATSTGSLVSGNCIKADANGNLVDNGATCATASRVLLETLTASTSATLVTAVTWGSTYSTYEIVFEGLVPATNNVQGRFRPHSGGSYQTTTYASNSLSGNTGGTSTISSSTYIHAGGDTTRAVGTAVAGVGVTGILRVNNVAGTAKYKQFVGQFSFTDTGSLKVMQNVAGAWEGGFGAVDGAQFSFSSGNITDGTIKVYGLN